MIGRWLKKLLGASAVGGGASTYRTLDGQNTGVNVKVGTGAVVGWYLFNASASVRYVKLYDKATAPTQADMPLVTLPLPVSNQGANLLGTGPGFVNGLGIRVTTGLADNDNGAPTANDVQVNLFHL